MLQQTYIDRLITTALDEDIHYIDVTTDNLLDDAHTSEAYYLAKDSGVLLREQLDLAKQLDLPVIIHARDCTEDYLRILQEFRPRGVVHCFSGSAETAREVLKLGMYIGFTGVLTFKNAKKALKALAEVPEDKLVLETDCPYMAPVPFRGKRCDSRMIPYTAEAAALVRGTDTQTILEQTCRNGEALFGIRSAAAASRR